MDIDEALVLVGGYRRYHLVLSLLLCMSSFMPFIFYAVSIVFFAWTPPHHCAIPENQTKEETIPLNGDGTYSSCYMYVNPSESNDTKPCTSWYYDSDGYKTMVTEFDLVCEGNYFAEMSQMLSLLGSIVPDVLCSHLTDRFGRKRIHMASLYATSFLAIGLAVSPNYITLVIFRISIGMAYSVVIKSGITLLIEIFDSNRRAIAGICCEFGWTLVYLMPLPLAYIATNWRIFVLICSLIPLIFTSYFWILPESASWLLAYNHFDEAELVLNRMARWNGVNIPPVHLRRPSANMNPLKTPARESAVVHKAFKAQKGAQDFVTLENDKMVGRQQDQTACKPQNEINDTSGYNQLVVYHELPDTVERNTHFLLGYNEKACSAKAVPFPKSDRRRVPVLTLIKDPKLRMHLLMSTLFWFSNSAVYYGLILNVPSYGNRFLTFLFLGLTEIPAYVLTLWVVSRYGRRWPMSAFFALAGLGLIVTVVIPRNTSDGRLAIMCLVLLSHFAISASFALMVLYVRELFPTNVRAFGLGLTAVGASFGHIIAAFIAYIGKLEPKLPNVIFGIIALVAVFGAIPLPETKNKPLPLNLDELYEVYYSKTRRKNNTRDHTG